jgi:hypothetical protein
MTPSLPDPSLIPPPTLPPPTLAPPSLPSPLVSALPPAPPPVVKVREKAKAVEVSLDSWSAMLRDSLLYPMRKDGWAVIFGAALLCSIPIIGAALLLCVVGFAAPYYLRVVETTIGGDDKAPDWPAVSNFMDDIAQPLVAFFFAGLLAALPYILYQKLVPPEEQSMIILLVCEAFRALYWPMAVLGFAWGSSAAFLLPHLVIPAILRTIGGYWVVAASLAVLAAGTGLAFALAQLVPLVGGLIGYSCALYGFVSQGRLLGLFHRRYREQIGW